MLCPDCKCNTFEPEYKNMPGPCILDGPYAQYAPPAIRLVPLFFRCSACTAIYYVLGNETVEQAYWRIIRDHAK